jgi:molybdopterin/thiamine biosynthesis adenylyltransferase
MPKPKLNALIIGAGGVTSYMLPALKNSFDLEANIIDGDKLEKKNLDRQLFRTNMVGEYKAKALMRQYNFRQKDGQAICQYFDRSMLDTPYKIFFSQADVYICAVDNHPARKAIIETALRYSKPVVVCANEYHTSQAFIFDPSLASMQCQSYHPFERYPEITTDKSGSPISCQGDALESTPQLAIANQMAATFGNYLVWSWFGMPHKPDMIDYKPVEFQSTFSRMQTKTMEDFKYVAEVRS